MPYNAVAFEIYTCAGIAADGIPGENMYRIGIDLGGTKIAAALVNADNKIIKKLSAPTEPERGNDFIAGEIATLTNRLLTESGIDKSLIDEIGLASPGAIDCDTGYIERACNLLMEHYPMVDKLRELTGFMNIKLENDANAAALGEAVAGAARGAKYSVMITLGTGVGGGFIIDGKVYSGCNFAGGEFGHMVIEHGGRKCSCGRRGCWEAYSSATAIIEMTEEAIAANPDCLMAKLAADNGRVSGKTAFAAARAGDAAAQKVVDTYISYLACGIINVVNLFQPDVLSIGGGMSNEGKGLIDPLLKAISKESFTKGASKQTVIRIASLGNDAGIIGAANL